jgi:hypothetical protein
VEDAPAAVVAAPEVSVDGADGAFVATPEEVSEVAAAGVSVAVAGAVVAAAVLSVVVVAGGAAAGVAVSGGAAAFSVAGPRSPKLR